MLIYNCIKYSVFAAALLVLPILALMHAAEQPLVAQNTKNKAKNKGKPGRSCTSVRGEKGVYNKDGVCGPIPHCKTVGQSCIWPECTAYPCPLYFYVTAGTCNEHLVCEPRHGVPITEGDR